MLLLFQRNNVLLLYLVREQHRAKYLVICIESSADSIVVMGHHPTSTGKGSHRQLRGQHQQRPSETDQVEFPRRGIRHGDGYCEGES